jgi:hypothetical protein
MTDPKSDDFDWVTARSQCSAATVFERLRVRTIADANLRNKLRESDGVVAPIKLAPESHSFSVMRGPIRVVRFVLQDEAIHVSDEKLQTTMVATLTLNNEGECRLRVGEEELQLWQFCKRALEGLFFD